MLRKLLAAAAALVLATSADAASLTPPNLTTQSTLANADLFLVWPTASVGPLQSMPWSTFKAQIAAGLGTTWLLPANNLSDLASPTTARTNLGLGTAALAFTGTSGGTICLLNASCTWTMPQLFQGGTSGSTAYLVNLQNPAGTINTNGVGISLDATGDGVGVRDAQIVALQDNSDNGTALHLKTNQSGSGPGDALVLSPTKQLQLPAYSSAGVLVNDASGNVTSSAPTSWTPSFTFSSPGNLSVAYTTRAGQYLKVGGFCVATFQLTFMPSWTTSSGVPEIPLPVAANATYFSSMSGSFGSWAGITSVTNGPPLPLPTTVGGGWNIGVGSGGSAAQAFVPAASFVSGNTFTLNGTVTYAC